MPVCSPMQPFHHTSSCVEFRLSRPKPGASPACILLHQSYCKEQTINSEAKLKVRGRVWKEQNDNNKVPLLRINLPHFRPVRGSSAVTNAKVCIQWSQTQVACSLCSICVDPLCWVFDSCGIAGKTELLVIGRRASFWVPADLLGPLEMNSN